jgi:Cu-Zn family superoxide dismutase
MRLIVGVVTALVLGSQAALSVAATSPGTVSVVNGNLQPVGEMTLRETPNGFLIRLDLQANPPGIAPGVHAIHIHEVGECVPPFTSVGAHFNPAGKQHGFLAAKGKHVGDLPNLHVPANAALTVEFLIAPEPRASEKGGLLDADGFALVIHQSADDYKSDPAGASGDRIACAAFRPSGQSKSTQPKR